MYLKVTSESFDQPLQLGSDKVLATKTLDYITRNNRGHWLKETSVLGGDEVGYKLRSHGFQCVTETPHYFLLAHQM